MERQFIRTTVLAGLFVVGITGAHAQSSNSPATPKTDLSKPEKSARKTPDHASTGSPALSEHFSAPSGGLSSGAHKGNESPTRRATWKTVKLPRPVPDCSAKSLKTCREPIALLDQMTGHGPAYESVMTENDRPFQQVLSSGLPHESSEDDD